jgi:hypothetical protein
LVRVEWVAPDDAAEFLAFGCIIGAVSDEAAVVVFQKEHQESSREILRFSASVEMTCDRSGGTRMIMREEMLTFPHQI